MASPSFRPRTLAAHLALYSAWVEARMAYDGLPGLAIALVRDQEVVWSRGFGHSDRDGDIATTPGTGFRVASITKLFTATALLQLRDARALRLDDPVNQHLPWFDPPPAEGADRPITLRHLLTHTSGLPREAPLPYWNDQRFPDTRTLRELVAGLQPTLPPERAWKYSNLGFALAGEVVAAAAKVPYGAYVRRYILEPLRMTDSRIDTPDLVDRRIAVGFGRRLPDGSREASPHSDCLAITPAANLTTTALDLARFARLQFRDGPAGGEQILSGDTLHEMQRVHRLDPDGTQGWGLGFNIRLRDGDTYLGHGGSLRGYRSRLLLRPSDRVAVVALTNADDGAPDRFVDRAFDWLAPHLDRLGDGSADAPNRFTPYLGRYRNSWGDTQLLALDGALALLSPLAADPLAALAELEPSGDHTFRLRSGDGYSSRDEEVVFEMEGALARRVRVGATWAERIEHW
jgi:CubicO group peptidase (beta-lactamase class C family)